MATVFLFSKLFIVTLEKKHSNSNTRIPDSNTLVIKKSKQWYIIMLARVVPTRTVIILIVNIIECRLIIDSPISFLMHNSVEWIEYSMRIVVISMVEYINIIITVNTALSMREREYTTCWLL